MLTNEKSTFPDGLETDQPAEIATKVDFCMEHYRPYIRHDFNLHQLSVITKIPGSEVENYFRKSPLTFDQYLDHWRVRHAKSLMDKKNNWNLGTKTIGSLSGFSSAKKFAEAFTRLEGISPEDYQSQITKSLSI